MKPRRGQYPMAEARQGAAEIVNLSRCPGPAPAVRLAAGLLRDGELVAVPTETVYGLLANADLPAALEGLSRAKGRPVNRPYTCLIADVAALAVEPVEVSPAAQRLIGRFWPGPLTVVLRVGEGWRGFRLPDHPLAREIVRAAGCRVAAPSANRSGSAEPITAQDVVRELGDRIRLILDGGPCRMAKPSTVVRVSGDKVEILRVGAIPQEEIEKAAKT